jgi:Putative prokaryotic signal transducing protein
VQEELKIVTTVGNQAEAEMVGEWLSEAGIRSVPQMSAGDIRLGAAAPRDVYVNASDYERALEVLRAEVPSDAELEALSQQAVTQPSQPQGRDASGEPSDPLEIPVPEEDDVLDALGDAAEGPPSGD